MFCNEVSTFASLRHRTSSSGFTPMLIGIESERSVLERGLLGGGGGIIMLCEITLDC